MKSALAKARDKWFESDDGKECCEGQASSQYLQNRLERAFLAGADFSSERIKELEGYNEGARDCLRSAKKQIEELKAENKKLREANKHYLEVCLENQKLEGLLEEKKIALANELNDCVPYAGAKQMRIALDGQIKELVRLQM